MAIRCHLILGGALLAVPDRGGHCYGEVAAGGNYGVLYAIAKGSCGLYGGMLSTVVIMQHGFSVAIGVAVI